jgi:MFS family permease
MFKNRKNIQLKISSFGHAYNDAYHFIIPLLLPFFRQEFMFSYFQSGLILAAHVALRSIFSLIFGFLGDRFNHKHLFISFGFIFSSILLGSLLWISNLPFMITALLLMAVGVSTFHPLATAMVGEYAMPDKKGRDLCLFNAAGTLGLSVMSLTFGWFVQMWGWRMACLIVSLPGFLLAWGYAHLKNGTVEDDIKAKNPTNQFLFIIYFISRGLRGLGNWAILSFLPLYATDHIGMSPALSAWFVSIYFAGELSGSLLMSRFLDKSNPLKIGILTTLITALLTLTITYNTITSVIGIMIVSIGFFQGVYYPSQHTWVTNVSSNQTRGKLFGLTFFVEGVSATTAPFLYGWLADQFGLVYAYRMASIPIFLSFLLYIFTYYIFKKHFFIKLNSVPA